MGNEIFDLIIIGAGPTGISIAIEAEKHKLRYVILEKGYLVNSIYNFPTNMTFFSSSDKLEIGEIPFITNNEKPTRSEALEYYRRLIFHYNINIKFNTKVESINKVEDFILQSSTGVFSARNVVLATGYYDLYRPLNILGENLKKVKHYYDDAHPYIGKDIVVIGAANSACDIALETWTKGANVTMVIRGAELYQGVKYWILPNIQNRIKEGSIKAYFESEVIEIHEDHVIVRDKSYVKIKLKNDFVLAMTGYQIDYNFLRGCGVDFDDSKENNPPIFNEENLMTNVEGLYVAGVILSGTATSKLFIENTRHHGQLILQDIVKKAVH